MDSSKATRDQPDFCARLTTISEVGESPEGSLEVPQAGLQNSLQSSELLRKPSRTPQSFFSKLKRQFSGRFFRKDLSKNRCLVDSFPACSSEPTSSNRSESEDDDVTLQEIDDLMKSDGKRRLSPIQLTSLGKVSKLLQAPAVYEDPYCSVAVDGAIYVSEYYLTSSVNAIRRFGNREPKSSKRAALYDIATVFHCRIPEAPLQLYKEWGLSRNSVWWANDYFRRLHDNPDTELVVLRIKSTFPIQLGLTVVNFTAFKSAMLLCGLSEQCHFISNLPAVNCDIIRFIDDTEAISVDDEYAS